MKAIKEKNNHIYVHFSKINKSEFYDLLEKIKSIKDRKFDSISKNWIIPKTEDNIFYLKQLGFTFDNDIVTDVLSELIIENNIIKIISSFEVMQKLVEYFTFEDKSYAFAGGTYNPANVFKKRMLKFKKDFGILPIGFYKDLILFLNSLNLEYEIKDHRNILHESEINYTYDQIKNNLHYLELRPEQVESTITCLNLINTIIKIPTGVGKTEIILSICNLIDLKILILFARIDLAQQTLRRAEKANLDCGIVQGQNVDEDHRIIMCTVQSAHKLKNEYQAVIVDECHRSSSKQYQKILKKDSFIYRFGFSATPFPKDAYKKALVKQWLGGIGFEMKADDAVKKGYIARPIIHMIEINRPYGILDDDWFDAENGGIIKNEYRNNKIIELANRLNNVMILVKRIEHGEILKEQIPNSVFLYGNSAVQDRNDYVELFEKNQNFVLIASTIFDEGISINSIKNLIIASGGNNYKKTLQKIGRGVRIDKGKTSVHIYDFIDKQNHILERHSKNRTKIYKEEGYTDIIME